MKTNANKKLEDKCKRMKERYEKACKKLKNMSNNMRIIVNDRDKKNWDIRLIHNKIRLVKLIIQRKLMSNS